MFNTQYFERLSLHLIPVCKIVKRMISYVQSNQTEDFIFELDSYTIVIKIFIGFVLE